MAPLGTALTENQLALLWKMVDEPILCFDGDRAGQKAAYRAADLAMPHLKPGKSLRFALLPEGQDPDDLVRSGGRGAVEEVLGVAKPLAEMIWAREIEGGSFNTPERRAALEAKIGELSNGIRDEVVRRHYRQDLSERLHRAFAPRGRRPRLWPGRPRIRARLCTAWALHGTVIHRAGRRLPAWRPSHPQAPRSDADPIRRRARSSP